MADLLQFANKLIEMIKEYAAKKFTGEVSFRLIFNQGGIRDSYVSITEDRKF